jgi:hypothetical protein
MARGQRSEDHPGRRVPRERWDMKGWNITGHEIGAKQGQAEDEHFIMSTWAGPKGHTAEVEQRHGDESYTAGPFRTQFRSQVAAESLTERARTGDADQYKRR